MRIEGEVSEVKAGDAIAIPPGKKHKLWNTGNGPLTLLCCCAPFYEHSVAGTPGAGAGDLRVGSPRISVLIFIAILIRSFEAD